MLSGLLRVCDRSVVKWAPNRSHNIITLHFFCVALHGILSGFEEAKKLK